MSAAADVGSGVAITFSSGFLAQVNDVNWSGVSRPAIATSHMTTAAAGAGKFGNATFIPGHITDPGTLEVEVNYNPDTLVPIASAAETVTVTYDESGGDSTGANWAASGFMVDWSGAVPFEDKMTATVSVKLSGNITRTAGS